MIDSNDATPTHELEMRIAAVRENLRDLIEQATAFSGAADESRTADRIENEEAHLAKLIAERDLSKV